MNIGNSLKRSILIPMGGILALLLLLAIYAVDRMNRLHAGEEIQHTQRVVNELFSKHLGSEAASLSALLETLARDPRLVEGLRRHDRVALLRDTADLYRHLRERNGITHFYFSGADRVNLLRVHTPERYGDVIDRLTTLRAERDGTTAWGLELGPLGLLTLRVVRPIVVQGRLLGYLELGEEIGHVIRSIAEVANVDIHVLIHKRMLDRSKWEAGNRVMGRAGDWNRFPDQVLGESTGPLPPDLMASYHASHDHRVARGDALLSWEQARRPLFLPLRDAAGLEVAEMVMEVDVSGMSRQSHQLVLFIIGLGLPLSLALLVLFYFLLHRIQLHLQSAVSERESLAAKHIETLRAREEHIRLLLDSTAEAIYGVDADGRCIFVNPAFLAMLGYDSIDDLLGRDIHELVHHSHADGRPYPEQECLIYAAFAENRPTHADDEVFWHKDGYAIPVEYWAHPIRRNGQVVGAVAAFLDISARKQAEAQLVRLAHYDHLTGLPNRVLLQSRLRHTLEQAKRHGTQGALLFLDLDHFKNVNDSLGHTAGDELLIEVGKRIAERIREVDTLARLGGDEFVVLLECLERAEDAAVLAQNLIDRLNHPFTLADGHTIYIGSSIGISLFPGDSMDGDALMRNADAALFKSKSAGRNTYHFYTESLTTTAKERLDLEQGLRHALEAGEFILHYQPQVATPDAQPVGVEALVRWQPTGQAMVPPARFISIAEETGLIVPLGEWVLRTACAQARRWLDAGLPAMTLAVNLSPRQFRDPDLVAKVRRILLETGLPPALLELEITESVIMEESEHALGVLHNLKEIGLSLSIDDFGTGYSSLAYLKRFAIDKLKIDQSFVRDIPDDLDSMEITASIIAMAKNLRLKVLAEGVETEDQLAFLQIHDCNACQGYLFSRPLPAEALERWLLDWLAGDAQSDF